MFWTHFALLDVRREVSIAPSLALDGIRSRECPRVTASMTAYVALYSSGRLHCCRTCRLSSAARLKIVLDPRC